MNKLINTAILAAALFAQAKLFAADPASQPVPPPTGKEGAARPERQTDPESLARYADMRFGVMFHWGPAVLRNNEISWSMSNRAEYEAVYKKFNPEQFNPDAWAAVATTTGAKYVIYVCKHHDGFCMWDTQTTDNNIMNTPFKRDVTGELAGACKRQNLLFGTYLSIMDIHEAKWEHCYPARVPMPGYPEGIPHIEEITAKQTLELLKKYDSQIMWYDGAWLQGWRTGDSPAKVAAAIKTHQPKVLITRLGNAVDDFECMEARIGTYRTTPWEMVTSVSYPTYSYNTKIKYKSAAYFVQTLSRVACGNGNLLLNFVPDAAGAIPDEQTKLAKEIGEWLKTHGEAIYGTRGGPWYPGAWGGSTRKARSIFVHLLPDAPETLHLPACGAKVLHARLPGGGDATVKQTDTGLDLFVPSSIRDPKVTIVELTMDAEVSGMIESSKPEPHAKGKTDSVPPPREEIPGAQKKS